MDPRANEYIIARPPVKKFSNGSPLDFSKRTSSESSSASVDRFCISFLFLFFFFFLCSEKHLSKRQVFKNVRQKKLRKKR